MTPPLTLVHSLKRLAANVKGRKNSGLRCERSPGAATVGTKPLRLSGSLCEVG